MQEVTEAKVLEDLRGKVLSRDFYLQDTMTCLQHCLGKIIVTEIDGDVAAGRIVEAEAYIGTIDKASHSYLGKHTTRTHIQFGVGGHAYIFSVHTYNQFCFVTGPENVSDVILIRSIEPIIGTDLMKGRRQKSTSLTELGNGPGKLCISLGINKSLYGNDLTIPYGLWLADDGTKVFLQNIIQTKRVGIDYAEEFKDVPWRYYVKDSPFVSRK
jgi:DNA-3-methyladenine glycosylase